MRMGKRKTHARAVQLAQLALLGARAHGERKRPRRREGQQEGKRITRAPLCCTHHFAEAAFYRRFPESHPIC